MSRPSLNAILKRLNQEIITNPMFRKALNTETIVVVLDEQELYNFIMMQLYLLVYPLKTNRGLSRVPEKEQFLSIDDAQSIAGVEFNSGLQVDDQKFNPLDAFKNDSEILKKVAKNAFNAMVSSGRSLVAKNRAQAGIVFGKAKDNKFRITEARGTKAKYTRNSKAVVFRLWNARGSSGNLYKQVKTKIFDKGTKIVQAHFAKTNEKYAPRADRDGFDTLTKDEQDSQRKQSNILDIGHLYASGNQLHKLTSEFKKLKGLIDDKNKSGFQKLFNESLGENILDNAASREKWGLHATIEKEHKLGIKRLTGKIEVVVTLESRSANQGRFADIETKTREAIERDIIDFLIREEVVDFKGSPSMRDDTVEFIEDSIVFKVDNTGKKKKPKKRKRKSSGKASKSITGTSKNTVGFKTTAKGKSPVFIPPEGGVAKTVRNLTSMTAIINEHLPAYLQKNMGKGASNLILNWRTGRFANSAQLKVLTEVQGSRGLMLMGLIDYMQNPYSVFRPGGRLHKPGRDPQLLINKSIRQIMRDKALAALSFKSRIV